MRTTVVLPLLGAVLTTLLGIRAASAEKTGGGHGGGGALAGVSAGLGQATGGGNGGNGGGGTRDNGNVYAEDQLPQERCPDGERPRRDVPRENRCQRRVALLTEGGVTTVAERNPNRYDGGRAKLDFYGSLEQVHDSDGAWSLEVGVHDRRLRLAGSVTRYFEQQGDGSRLTMTMPALVGSVRVDDGGPSHVYLQLGAVGVKTQNDPMTNTSITGALGGVRVEHSLSRRVTVVGDAQAMIFQQSIHAYVLRAGVRVGPLEASFRTLDFNIGPPLYGPEVGLRF